MKNRGTFGGGNGGLWMIRGKKRRTVDVVPVVTTEEEDETVPVPVSCSAETPDYSSSAQQYDTGFFSSLDNVDDDFGDEERQDVKETVACPVKVTIQKVVIATTTAQQQRQKKPRRSHRSMKRGIFGSRQRNNLTDSEISKKIRVALRQSSATQVSSSSDDDDEDEDPTSPQRKQLVGDSSYHDNDSSMNGNRKKQDDLFGSSQESLNSNLTFQEAGKTEVSSRNNINAAEQLHPSLAAARSFFAELDNLPLTVEDASHNPSAKKNYKLRTRRCKLPEPALQSEYVKYCAACVESSVKPLSISHFAEQRAKFFRQAEVFEGMFDE